MNLSVIVAMLGVLVVTFVTGTFAVQQTKGLGVNAESSNQDKISAKGIAAVLSNNMLPVGVIMPYVGSKAPEMYSDN